MSAQHTPGPWELRASKLANDFGIIVRDEKAEGGWAVIAEAFSEIRSAGERAPDALPNARLMAAAPDMLAALIELEQFHAQEGEGPTERFERLGEIFHRETGHLRPGKDASPASGACYEERVAAWDKWSDGRIARARAAIAKATGSAA